MMLLSLLAQPCPVRYNGPNTGVNRTAAPPQATIADWQQRLRQKQGTPAQLLALEKQLLNYTHAYHQQAALETYVNTLPLYNDAAFHRLALYLLDRYRALGQPTAANRVRNLLLVYGSQDADIVARVKYSDVLYRTQQARAGLSAADSTALAQMAGSAVGYAPVACATLRAFYPGYNCTAAPSPVAPATKPVPAARAAAELAAPYPDPAAERVTLPYVLPAGARTAQLFVQDLRTGQTWATANVSVKEASGEITLALGQVPAGLYVCRLVVDGRTAVTRKLSVQR